MQAWLRMKVAYEEFRSTQAQWLLEPHDSPQWKILKDAERVGMSVADLNQWQRRRQDEINIANACLKQLHVPASCELDGARWQLNQLKQLIERMEMDERRIANELKSRPQDDPQPAQEPAHD